MRARGCADGSKQCKEPGYKKENAALSTVHNDSTFITSAIDAKENLDVMVVDLPGAFLHALRRAGATKKQLLMVLRGLLVETMVLMDPTLYRPFITYDRTGIAVLYVEMDKALYRLLESA